MIRYTSAIKVLEMDIKLVTSRSGQPLRLKLLSAWEGGRLTTAPTLVHGVEGDQECH